MDIEKEFKILLNPDEYKLLLDDRVVKTQIQENFYLFNELTSKKLSLRIRKIKNNRILTLKYKLKNQNGAKISHEWEQILSKKIKIKIFNKKNLDQILIFFENRSEILKKIPKKYLIQKYVLKGVNKTVRKKMKQKIKDNYVIFEIDKTSFNKNWIGYELEIETQDLKCNEKLFLKDLKNYLSKIYSIELIINPYSKSQITQTLMGKYSKNIQNLIGQGVIYKNKA